MRLDAVQRVFEGEQYVVRLNHPPFDLLAESESLFIAVKVYQDIGALVNGWSMLQAVLADEFFRPGRVQPEKYWDTYLVLCSPGLTDLNPEMATLINDIHSNVAYCRKLLVDSAVGDDGELLKQKLAPLLRLGPLRVRQGFSPLEALRHRLLEKKVPMSLIALLDETEPKRLIQMAKGGN